MGWNRAYSKRRSCSLSALVQGMYELGSRPYLTLVPRSKVDYQPRDPAELRANSGLFTLVRIQTLVYLTSPPRGKIGWTYSAGLVVNTTFRKIPDSESEAGIRFR